MPWAILDTNVYVDHWEGKLPLDSLAAIRRGYVVRHSAVVLSELRRGARTKSALKLVESIRGGSVAPWEPLGSDWWEAGGLIQKIGDQQKWERSKRRDFQNDALIALTARRHGAAVVTSNLVDFEWLAKELGIHVVEP